MSTVNFLDQGNFWRREADFMDHPSASTGSVTNGHRGTGLTLVCHVKNTQSDSWLHEADSNVCDDGQSRTMEWELSPLGCTVYFSTSHEEQQNPIMRCFYLDFPFLHMKKLGTAFSHSVKQWSSILIRPGDFTVFPCSDSASPPFQFQVSSCLRVEQNLSLLMSCLEDSPSLLW